MSLRSVCVLSMYVHKYKSGYVYTQMHACLCLGASLGCDAHYKRTVLWQRLF